MHDGGPLPNQVLNGNLWVHLQVNNQNHLPHYLKNSSMCKIPGAFKSAKQPLSHGQSQFLSNVYKAVQCSNQRFYSRKN